MTTYEWCRVLLAGMNVLVTLSVPFVMIRLERKYGLGLRSKDDE